ncbi:MAG: DNA-binding response regulator [Anaerolineae bacterium]|nr:MAG: DNA-binding response regulator [Anaerolineae bacterium]
MEQITLVVIDDHPLFRQGVANALAIDPRFKVVGQEAHGERGLELIQALRPRVAVVDVNLPGMNGQQITHELATSRIPTRVILMTAYDDAEQMLHAAIAGAAAYCSKDIQPDELTKIIFHVLDGKYVMGQQVMTKIEFESWLARQLDSARRSYSEPGSPFHPLSDREMEVLELVVEGRSNKEIATQLGISHQTVKNHITSILRKFGVEDRTQAVVYALKRGWVKLNYESHAQE